MSHRRTLRSNNKTAPPTTDQQDQEGHMESDFVWSEGEGWVERHALMVKTSTPIETELQAPLLVEVSIPSEQKPVAITLAKLDPTNTLFNATVTRRILRRFYSSQSRKPPSLIKIGVFGQSSITRRDRPLIEAGYQAAFPTRFVFSDDLEQTDLMLCLSLSTCNSASAKDDVFFLPSDSNLVRINRIPRLRLVLWSKHAFCNSVPKWVAQLVSFPCWVLPNDYEALSQASQAAEVNQQWIAKPWSSGGGHGIIVLDGPQGIDSLLKENVIQGKTTSNGKKYVVQPFLGNPLLIKKRKIDLRVYVLVTNTVPMRAYVHSRGLVRFASEAYDGKAKSKTQFLTNTSINKNSKLKASDLTWPFLKLWETLGWEKSKHVRLHMDRVVGLILLSVEDSFRKLGDGGICDRTGGTCYALLGFDVILAVDDGDMITPRVIEVNGEPSFARGESDSRDGDHYDETKIIVARDVARVVFSAPGVESDGEALELYKEVVREVETVVNEGDGGDQVGDAQVLLVKFASYLLELTRESRPNTEFRPCYPFAMAGETKPINDAIEKVFRKDKTRLLFHRVLTDWAVVRAKSCFALLENRKWCSDGTIALARDLYEVIGEKQKEENGEGQSMREERDEG